MCPVVNLKGCAVYESHARFAGPHSVEVAGEILKAKWIFINVGGRALAPPIPGLDKVGYFTNGSMMDVDFLPPNAFSDSPRCQRSQGSVFTAAVKTRKYL